MKTETHDLIIILNDQHAYDISRSSGMAKTILQGTVKGARRRGRQKKRLEDNIKEWMGMGFGDSLRAADDREGWKGIVATSSVVPRRPPRLRDWDERCLWQHLSHMTAPIAPRLRDSDERWEMLMTTSVTHDSPNSSELWKISVPLWCSRRFDLLPCYIKCIKMVLASPMLAPT